MHVIAILLLLAAPAIAADIPVPPKGVTAAQMREAIKDLEARKKMPQKKFEQDLLSAPIGKGRLE
jgi:hypothetical protein